MITVKELTKKYARTTAVDHISFSVEKGQIVGFLGPEAANPIDYEDQDWPSDPWSRGCYGAFMFPGVLTTVGKSIRTPFGRIHWAGTETATIWTGYIDGAIRSGAPCATCSIMPVTEVQMGNNSKPSTCRRTDSSPFANMGSSL